MRPVQPHWVEPLKQPLQFIVIVGRLRLQPVTLPTRIHSHCWTSPTATGRVTNTGQGACLSTRSVFVPNNVPNVNPSPCAPIQMRSMSFSTAYETISL